MPLCFSTKAGTLSELQSILSSARIAPLQTFTVADWNSDQGACLECVSRCLGSSPWIVRSSCHQEDGIRASNAGAFLSVPHVDKENLETAIEDVIASYGKVQPTDEVLIQPMLTDVIRSGVAFSHDPNTRAPYRVINWSEGHETTTVTGGVGGRIWQQAADSPVPSPPIFTPIVTLLEELLTLFGGTPLDCEFAVTYESKREVVWLLQVRPLILSAAPEASSEQAARLKIVEHKVNHGMQPHPFLMGRRTVYGVMPDWNPAEIIGTRPRPLALSLYRDLVTDAVWAYQRHNYGYRNLRSFPLMRHFFGLPYIDVRVSFNSFIPADLDEGLAGRLVDYYIDRLLAEPSLHDKVEFEIVFSCYTMDLPQRLACLEEIGFSKQECGTIVESLRRLTNRVMHPKDGLWRGDVAKLDTLNARRDLLLSSVSDPLERIYWLLEDAKRYGTLPFAGLARIGFMAVQMLRSLVAIGILSESDQNNFIKSISTVSSQLIHDRSVLDKTTFLAHYGHLRPGTYDILSPRYDEAPELYFDWSEKPPVPDPPQLFSLTLSQMRDVRELLEQHELHIDPVGLFDFIQTGIEQREHVKFHFTRNVSDALALIMNVGQDYGFDREDLAYCDIGIFKELYTASLSPKDMLARSIEQGKKQYAETLKTSLPPLITQPEDIWAFEWPDMSPNFVTRNCVVAPVVGHSVQDKLAGSIVCIPSADPGFDWLFSHSIAGLITAWGGANSHMAIRAGELDLPAVIGAGETLYRCWSGAQKLRLECAEQRVEVLA